MKNSISVVALIRSILTKAMIKGKASLLQDHSEVKNQKNKPAARS